MPNTIWRTADATHGRKAGLGEAARTNRVSGSDLFLAQRHSSTACFKKALLLVATATEDINPVTNTPPFLSLEDHSATF